MTDRGRFIASRIRQARRDLSLTQRELAERAGCCTRFISMLETGKRDPASMEVAGFARLAKALYLPMGKLYHGERTS
jgi:transcriptional regulator with XRE-family HTH domain